MSHAREMPPFIPCSPEPCILPLVKVKQECMEFFCAFFYCKLVLFSQHCFGEMFFPEIREYVLVDYLKASFQYRALGDAANAHYFPCRNAFVQRFIPHIEKGCA